MKTSLQKFIGTVALGLTLLSTSLPVWAGFTDLYEVSVSTSTKIAGGSMAGARYSTDSTQYIGCRLQRGQIPPNEVYCEARDRYKKIVACSSSNARHVAAVKAMTDSSYIFFSADPDTNRCKSLTVRNSSAYLK